MSLSNCYSSSSTKIFKMPSLRGNWLCNAESIVENFGHYRGETKNGFFILHSFVSKELNISRKEIGQHSILINTVQPLLTAQISPHLGTPILLHLRKIRESMHWKCSSLVFKNIKTYFQFVWCDGRNRKRHKSYPRGAAYVYQWQNEDFVTTTKWN